MRYPSKLIFELARSVEAATPEVADGIVAVPTVLVPHIALQQPQRLTESIMPGQEVVRQSFHTDFVRFRSAVDGLGTLGDFIATFSKGLWRVGCALRVLFDATAGAASADNNIVFGMLTSPPEPLSSDIPLVTVMSIQGHQQEEFERTFMFGQDGWHIKLFTQQPTASQYLARLGVTGALLT
jgi:hypothetical protein